MAYQLTQEALNGKEKVIGDSGEWAGYITKIHSGDRFTGVLATVQNSDGLSRVCWVLPDDQLSGETNG